MSLPNADALQDGLPVIISPKLREGELVHPMQRYAHTTPIAAARMEVSFWREAGMLTTGRNPRMLTLEEAAPLQRAGRQQAKASGNQFPEPSGPQGGDLVKPGSRSHHNNGRGFPSVPFNGTAEDAAFDRSVEESFHAGTPEKRETEVDLEAGEGDKDPSQELQLPPPPPKPEKASNPPGSGDPDQPEFVPMPDFKAHEEYNQAQFSHVNIKTEILAEAIPVLVKRIKTLEESRVFPTPVVVKFGDKAALPDHNAGLQHYLFPVLLTIIQAGVNAYLPGPAGAGKTKGCRNAAKALGLDFRMVSVCEETSAASLMGYMDAQGRYVRSPLRECFENGGVFLLDEMDAGAPNTLTVINAITSTEIGETASFPDGMVYRHENFRFVAAGNTFGTGASFHYVGRNRLDAATLDRMAYLTWPVDASLEAALVGVVKPRNNPELTFGGCPSAEKWLGMVDCCRKAANEHDMKVILSPRSVMMGCRLSAAGLGAAWLKDLLIYKDLPESSQEILHSAMEEDGAIPA